MVERRRDRRARHARRAAGGEGRVLRPVHEPVPPRGGAGERRGVAAAGVRLRALRAAPAFAGAAGRAGFCGRCGPRRLLRALRPAPAFVGAAARAGFCGRRGPPPAFAGAAARAGFCGRCAPRRLLRALRPAPAFAGAAPRAGFCGRCAPRPAQGAPAPWTPARGVSPPRPPNLMPPHCARPLLRPRAVRDAPCQFHFLCRAAALMMLLTPPAPAHGHDNGRTQCRRPQIGSRAKSLRGGSKGAAAGPLARGLGARSPQRECAGLGREPPA